MSLQKLSLRLLIAEDHTEEGSPAVEEGIPVVEEDSPAVEEDIPAVEEEGTSHFVCILALVDQERRLMSRWLI